MPRDNDPAPSRTLWQLLCASLLTGILAFAALALVGCQMPGPISPEEAGARSVSVFNLCPMGLRYRGSGTVVGPDKILTALHVVERCIHHPAAFVASDGTIYVGMADNFSFRHDAALFHVEELQPRHYDPAPTLVPHALIEVEDELCVISAQPRKDLTEPEDYRCGPVKRRWSDGLLAVDFSSVPGNSGSGVYHHDRLIGILMGRWTEGELAGLASVSLLPDFDLH